MSKLKQKYSELQYSSTEEEEEDDDVIQCICDSTADDGFTIQCEECDMWQHAKCYEIKKRNIPEHFICDRCNTRRRSSSLEIKGEYNKKTVKFTFLIACFLIIDKRKQKEFVSINKNIAKEKVVQDLFMEVHRQWMESNRSKHGTSKKTGNKGLDSIVVMESNLLLPAIPKASLKPIRKSLRASFFQNKNDPTVKKGVFADIHIPENRYLMEVTGQVVRKSEYKNEARNQFLALGTPLPHVFFYPMLDVCIDARYTGNDARFIRRSCCPNSEVKSVILPNDSEDQTIHMGIYTKEAVDKGEEITIGWNWHRTHVMWRKNKEFLSKSNTTAEIMNEETKKSLQETINLIQSQLGKCACEDEEDCLFEYLKDELQREEQKETTKKKTTKPTNIIFSSDEDENSKPKKLLGKSQKQVKFIEKSTPSPAVSVDIDITSMSPVPEEVTTVGIKRNRTSTGIQLPCKKKWLHDYIVQQRQQKEQEQVIGTDSPVNKPPLIENVYEEGSLSDGGSSQSTLPLDLPAKDTIESEETKSIEIQPELCEDKANTSSISEPSEFNDSAEGTPPIEDEKPAPKVKKLSIQEYLKRQRGNLPTPDEKL
jgi:hypothetical protein